MNRLKYDIGDIFCRKDNREIILRIVDYTFEDSVIYYKLNSHCGLTFIYSLDEINDNLILNTQHLVKTKSNEADKFDDDKIPVELLSTVALNEIAKVLAFGAKKYDSHNWRKGMSHSRLLGASLRHIFAYLGGEDKDPESGLNHLAHAGCCIMFLLEYIKLDLGTDDRYKGESK